MPRTAKSRYVIAAALWSGALAWIVLDPTARGLYVLLVALLAVTATVCAAIVERDERVQEIIRLSWWAATAVAPTPPAWPGVDRAAD